MSPVAPPADGSGGLFRERLDQWLAANGMSRDELRRWCSAGWVAGDSITDEMCLLDPAFDRLGLVRDVARSGLDDAQISEVLRALPAVDGLRPDRVAFSFRFGWVEPADPPAIEELMDSWLETSSKEELARLLLRVEEKLKAADHSTDENP